MIYAKSKDRRVGRGGFDINSDSSPLEIVSIPSLPLPLPPPPPLTFFVTITYIKEIEKFFIIGSFYLQSYTKQTVRNCWTLYCLRTLPLLVQKI